MSKVDIDFVFCVRSYCIILLAGFVVRSVLSVNIICKEGKTNQQAYNFVGFISLFLALHGTFLYSGFYSRKIFIFYFEAHH